MEPRPAETPLAVARLTFADALAPDRQRRRGPGRPRKDWAARLGISEPSRTPHEPPCRPSRPLSPAAPYVAPDAALNVSQAELLHHFTVYTARSLVASARHRDHPVILFWQRNAPQLGFSHPYFLHMTLSLAAHHLRRLKAAAGRQEDWRYLGLATRHLSMGISGMNKALASMNSNNCGALLVSSMVICICTFAAGPTGPGDLLLCDLDGDTAGGRILPLIQGVRLIQREFDAGPLYTGLLRPLDPVIAGSLDDPRPTCVCQGFARISWVGPLDRLRKLVESDTSPNAAVYLRAFELVVTVYEAVYGDESGTMRCPTYYKMVLIFLYFAEDQFVACLRKGETLALLILAYYAPLLRADPNEWFLQGWAEHIVRNIRDRVGEEYAHYLDWPMEITS